MVDAAATRAPDRTRSPIFVRVTGAGSGGIATLILDGDQLNALLQPFFKSKRSLFDAVSGETLLLRLDLEGIAVSVGSACSSGTLAPSPAILALGLSPREARGVVRFSLSRATTDEEIARVLDVLPRLVEEIRGASPVAPVAPTAPVAPAGRAS